MNVDALNASPVSDNRARTSPRGRARLVGVGVGPGDPELLTLKAARAIREADVVFTPVRRLGEDSLALEIAGDQIDRERQRLVTLAFPARERADSWDAAAHEIVRELGADGYGVFLTVGDPLLFGSFGHVAAALRRLAPALPVEIVPGITSATAAAAAAGVSLVDRGERLAVVPATSHHDELARVLLEFDCVVLLKVGPVLGRLLDLLQRLALVEHAVYVRRCGQPGQQIVRDVRSLRRDPPTDYFALLIVHRPTEPLGDE